MSLSGHVSELSLADLIQINAMHGRTCRIVIHESLADGELYLEDGEVVHAAFGELVGNEAAYALLAVHDARFAVEPDLTTPARTVSQRWQHLLLEGARRRDEGSLSRPIPRAAAITQPPPVGPAVTPRRAWPRLLIASAMVLVVAGASLWWSGRAGDEPSRQLAMQPATAAAASVLDATELTGVDDAPPRLVSGEPPVAPDVGLALTPTVVCRLHIDEAGRVLEAKIYRSRLELAAFEEVALRAVHGYRFEPARRAGEPVAVWINWPVTFVERGAAALSRVQIKGSDTIGGALGPDLARAFTALHPDVTIDVEALGSSTAFVGLFDGTADIGASSRPIETEELDEAAQLGIALEEIVIGYDGIAVIVHPDNPIASLTLAQVSQLFSGEIDSWKDVGGRDLAVRRISRPSYSGTHAFFKDKVLRLGARDGDQEFADDTEMIERSEDIAAMVADDPASIAYLGLGWTDGAVAVVPLAPGPGRPAVAPGLDTVRDGSYPVYRPLLMYTRGRPTGAAASFLRYVLSPAGQSIVTGHGFVATDVQALPEALRETRAADAATPVVPEVVRVYFAAASSSLSSEARATLDEVAVRLAAGTHRAVVVGNADAIGGRDRNQRMSLLRANRVAEYLRARRAPAAALTVEAAAAARPIASNRTRDGRSENRRVDVLITPR